MMLLWTSSLAFSYDSKEFYNNIDATELLSRKNLALHGDFDSIYFMFRYYSVGKSDNHEAMQYVKIGADYKISFFDLQMSEYYYKEYKKCIDDNNAQCSKFDQDAAKYAKMSIEYSKDFPDQNVYSSDIKNQATSILNHQVNHYLF